MDATHEHLFNSLPVEQNEQIDTTENSTKRTVSTQYLLFCQRCGESKVLNEIKKEETTIES